MLKLEISHDLRGVAMTAEAKKKVLAGKIELAVRYSGLIIYNGARDKCPVDTANLRDSITLTIDLSGGETAAHIFSNVEYAFINEFTEKEHPITYHEDGTEKQKNPGATWGFFRKSLNEEAPNFHKRINSIMGAL